MKGDKAQLFLENGDIKGWLEAFHRCGEFEQPENMVAISEQLKSSRGKVEELKKTKDWLENQCKYRDKRICDLEDWINDLQKGKNWLEKQVRE